MSTDSTGINGKVNIVLLGPDGKPKMEIVKHNLITTAGDQYYAKMGIAGVSPANASAPTLVSKMQLGTGTTAAAKSGTDAAETETFIANSGVVFDATYPQAAVVSGDTGWKITYQTTWGAGVATNSAITEAVITTQTGANTTAVVADVISRVVFSAVNKGALDTLVISWVHTFFDAP